MIDAMLWTIENKWNDLNTSSVKIGHELNLEDCYFDGICELYANAWVDVPRRFKLEPDIMQWYQKSIGPNHQMTETEVEAAVLSRCNELRTCGIACGEIETYSPPECDLSIAYNAKQCCRMTSVRLHSDGAATRYGIIVWDEGCAKAGTEEFVACDISLLHRRYDKSVWFESSWKDLHVYERTIHIIEMLWEHPAMDIRGVLKLLGQNVRKCAAPDPTQDFSL